MRIPVADGGLAVDRWRIVVKGSELSRWGSGTGEASKAGEVGDNGGDEAAKGAVKESPLRMRFRAWLDVSVIDGKEAGALEHGRQLD